METPLQHLIELDEDIGAIEPLVERAPIRELIRGPRTAREEIKARAETAAMLLKHGMRATIDEKDEEVAMQQFNREIQQLPISTAGMQRPAVVLKLAALLSEYDHEVVKSAAQMRQYVTNRLLEESDPKQPASQRMKALHLLGQITEVGLFTERTEVTVKQLPADTLEAKLHEKLKILLPEEYSKILRSHLPPEATPDTPTGEPEV